MEALPHLPPEPEPRQGKWSQPRSPPAPSSKPRAWPCDKPTQHQRAFLALRGSSPSQPPLSQAGLPEARPSQRGVAHLAWTALAGGLGPGMGKAVCWFLPAHWEGSWVGVGGGDDNLGVLQLRSSCFLTKDLPQPCTPPPPGPLCPALGPLDDVARGQKSGSQ